MRLDLLLRISSKIFLPFIILFAFYVQFHGDFGPGGGFQAGVIFAAGIILYTIIFGIKKAQKDFPETIFNYMVSLGVLITRDNPNAKVAIPTTIAVRINT